MTEELIKLIFGTLSFLFSMIIKGNFHYPLLVISYFVLGYEVIINAVKNIFHGELLDENFLMTFATLAAALIGQYNEAVFVMLFYNIGEFAEELASDRSRKNIKKLLDIAPKKVHVGRNDVNPEMVETGTIITILPGERVPIDGMLVKGQCYLDTKSVTGESTPISCKKGDMVISGSIVLDSPVEIKTSTAFENSTVSRILKLIEENEEGRSNSEKFITKFAKYYTPIVVCLAVALAIIPSILTNNWHEWIYRALNFLVISCPCALVLSVPLAFFAGMGGCAHNGILVKGAEHLESLSKTNAVIFDKTGTLTKGELEVQKIHIEKQAKKKEILELAYALESSSIHPVAKAIVSYCKENKVVLLKAENITEHRGLGIEGYYKNSLIVAGNKNFLTKKEIKCANKTEAGSIIHIAKNNEYLGYILVTDSIKEEAYDVMNSLKTLGIKNTVMLSGDNEETAKSVAQKIGLDSYYSNLLPLDKVEKIKDLKKQFNCTYCGDGINDIPVMLESDTSIAMGAIGSDAAIEAADLVFTNDNLKKLPQAITRAKKTMRIVKQNIIFAIVCKLLCMVLGSLGITGLSLAIFADTGVAILAVLNSIRALY